MNCWKLLSTAIVMVALGACASSPAGQPEVSEPEREVHGGDPEEFDGHYERRFDNAEAWAKRFDEPGRDKWQMPDEVVRLLEIKPGMVVADIGAGTGYFIEHLSKAVGAAGRVHALDIEPDMVRYMKERAESEGLSNVSTRVVAGDDPAFDSASVDRVLIVNTWHHIPNRVEYSRKLLAGLRPGGAVVVVDYTKESPQGPPSKHRIPPDYVVNELIRAGFSAQVADEALPNQYVVVGRRKAR